MISLRNKLTGNYRHTKLACYTGYITQAAVCNFAALLYVTFQQSFSLSLGQISALAAELFAVQLIVDIISTVTVDKIGYRPCIVAAHITASAGFIALGNLPYIIDPFAGLVISVFLYSMGSGLIEVLVSPIVEACPTENKNGNMSLLHSFYCWGSVLVILVSTAYFSLFGIENWRYLAMLWAVLPLLNALYFCVVPIRRTVETSESLSLFKLIKKPAIYLFIILMLCSGASEIAMSQWASAFAEKGLQVTKTLGDLLGPCLFAFLMALGRVFYSLVSKRIDGVKYMTAITALCIVSYIIAVFSPNAVLSLAGCGLCGLSVAVMWPGCFSLASSSFPKGGTALFAILAFAGDAGCCSGPALVGLISQKNGDNLESGLFTAIIFPVCLIIGLTVYAFYRRKQAQPAPKAETEK